MSRVHVRQLWGTAITIDVREECPRELVDGAFAWFERVDDIFSTWRDDSEITRFSRGELLLSECAPELADVLALCDCITGETRGAFDVRVGADPRVAPRPGLGPVDPSGLVKGWAIERAAAALCSQGVHRFAIGAGGDLYIGTAPPGSSGWRVGIQHPHLSHATAVTIGCAATAVATSGRYERGDHVIDPRTGCPARGVVAATVVADDGARADAYATAALVLGVEAMEWLTEEVDVAALVITDDDVVVTNERFEALRVA